MSAPESYLGFVGVSTGSSSIQEVFPEWADALGLPTRRLVGFDVPPDAPPAVYHDLVTQMRADPQFRGALVTTHKLAVYAAARDLFDDLDEPARTFGEISCIARRGTRLVGSAKDPLTVRLALDDFVPVDHFAREGGDALILGSGGAGTALSHQLGARDDRPGRIICTALTSEPLDHARAVHERAGLPAQQFRYVVTADAAHVDQLLDDLPPASLVVNATGMGKDRAGSPLSAQAVFPERGVVWELNYRGSLDFWHQARRQQQERTLRIEDGWRYFVHGWTCAVAEVFDVPMDVATVDALDRIAARFRR